MLAAFGAVVIGATITCLLMVVASVILAMIPVIMTVATFVMVSFIAYMAIKFIMAVREIEKDPPE